MNKRLERIKEKMDNLKKIGDSEGNGEVNVLAIYNDISWLILQIEKLEETLATEYSVHKSFEANIVRENNRYREALEQIKEKGTYGTNAQTGKIEMSYEAGIAYATLEGDKSCT